MNEMAYVVTLGPYYEKRIIGVVSTDVAADAMCVELNKIHGSKGAAWEVFEVDAAYTRSIAVRGWTAVGVLTSGNIEVAESGLNRLSSPAMKAVCWREDGGMVKAFSPNSYAEAKTLVAKELWIWAGEVRLLYGT